MAVDLNVVNQWLRDFTVQILKPDGEIIGTGVAVSTDGKIVTCAHVIEALLGKHPRDAKGADVDVYFPEARGETKKRLARIADCFPQPYDDDVVLLQLADGNAPLGLEQIAVLGKCDLSAGHGFQSYGSRRIGEFDALFAEGKIKALIPPPTTKRMQSDTVQLTSSEINVGMSGAAVLDVEHNLVVGIVSQVWQSGKSSKDRDTAFGVNARVLSLDPLNLPLYEGELPYPRKAAPQPGVEAPKDARPASVYDLSRAPDPLQEWIGRDELLSDLMKDFNDPARRVVGLIGFGGEGKTSLARQWLASLLGEIADVGTHALSVPASPPDGVFWWSFYEQRSSDAFFEAALTYVGGEVIASRATSAAARAEIIAALLHERRYVFVLDGFEVMQHEEGDQFGSVDSDALRRFLTLLAAPDHNSFALLTSRAPLLDLVNYTTYRQHIVTRLSPGDGRALLHELGVTGADVDLDKVVEAWDGHALTLSLIGAYLKERFGGDVAQVNVFTVPLPDDEDEPSQTEAERRKDPTKYVRHILRRYDKILSDADRAFLKLFSVFRLPVKDSAFIRVFRTATDATAINAPLTSLDDARFNAIVTGLVNRRMIRPTMDESGELAYTAHPLVRDHYSRLLTAEHGAPETHHDIAAYYQTIARQDMPRFPTLDDLAPYIEVVFHLCRAGAYDEAHQVRRDRIDQGSRGVIVFELGAYETDLSYMLEFFPNGDSSADPQVSDPNAKSYILNEVGFCLTSLGRLREAAQFYERGNAIDADLADWHNASIGYQNLAELYLSLGDLESAAASARQALILAEKVENQHYQQQNKRNALAYLTWTRHLGNAPSSSLVGMWRAASASSAEPVDRETPAALFAQAEALERQLDPTKSYLYAQRGIRHAAHLRRVGDTDYARRVTETNLIICERAQWLDDISRCHRLLGDLDTDTGEHDSARGHYNTALRIAGDIQVRNVLIEALLARGRWYAKHMNDAPAAFNDLNMALNYATISGYRIHEADTRVALAWAHLRNGDPTAARAEAQHAKDMSRDMGYYWGGHDADELLAQL